MGEHWYNAVTGAVNFLDAAPARVCSLLNVDKILGSD